MTTPQELLTKTFMEYMEEDAEFAEKEIEDKFMEVVKTLVALYLLSTPKAKGYSFRLPKSTAPIFEQFRKEIRQILDIHTENALKFSKEKNLRIFNKLIKAPQLRGWLDRKIQDRTLNQRILKYTNNFKYEIEARIAIGIVNGESEAVLIREVKRFLDNPFDNLIVDTKADWKARRLAVKFNTGKGVYKSSFANAKRLVRSEMFEAYRRADYLIWSKENSVMGVLVYLNPAHPKVDICDDLVGLYPKDFFFTGWHPACYSDDTEVYTKEGWKLFKDLGIKDQIMTLNKESYDLEYSDIIMMTAREYEGNMIRFHNKALDMLVTPDHDMIYVNKTNGKTFDTKKASEYRKTHGALYRSSEWIGTETKYMNINGFLYNFDLFCEFMGYWLADGCIVTDRKYAITISAQEDKDFENRARIEECVSLITEGNYTTRFSGIHFHDQRLYEYLHKFGKALDKFIPEEIKNASKRQIKIFLNAFISCDGTIRPPSKSFINDRGNLCTPTSDERTYYTSSKKMAGDLGELILKIGKRPSFYINKVKGKVHKFKNGEYTINADNIRISECKSKTASSFYKDEVYYSGLVYDVELEKNHTLFVRRNGKCVWGSNCICLSMPYTRGELVGDVPEEAKEFMSKLKKDSSIWGLPFVGENKKYWKNV